MKTPETEDAQWAVLIISYLIGGVQFLTAPFIIAFGFHSGSVWMLLFGMVQVVILAVCILSILSLFTK